MPVPNNLIPVNASELSSSIQTLAGRVPATETVEIPEYEVLNEAIERFTFTNVDIDKIQETALSKFEEYRDSLNITDTLNTVSYGSIKNFINTKIDRIKSQRQKASVKAITEKLKAAENPYEYRRGLKNKAQKLRG